MKDSTPWIAISELKPHPKNARKHTDKQIEKIARSIKELDWGRPIIISNDNYILAGHGAYLAAKDVLKLKEVPYRQMPHQHDSPEALAYMVADNKLTDESEWNYGELQLITEEIKLEGFDVTLTGFEDVELKEIETKISDEKEVVEDDFDPETEFESIVNSGEIWQLGRHRLMCGDATKKEDVVKLIDNNRVDMVFTDPPYGFEDFNWLQPLVKNDCEIFVMNSDKYLVTLASIYDDYFKYFFTVELSPAILVNNKMAMTGHDLIAYFRKGKTRLRNLHDAFSTHLKLNKRKDGEHRHEKRLELPSNFIKHYSFKDEMILDLFGGSGSTLIACEQLERNCYMMELEPESCDIIIKRYEEFTEEKAKKI